MIRSIYLCYICKYSTYAGKINIFHFWHLLLKSYNISRKGFGPVWIICFSCSSIYFSSNPKQSLCHHTLSTDWPHREIAKRGSHWIYFDWKLQGPFLFPLFSDLSSFPKSRKCGRGGEENFLEKTFSKLQFLFFFIEEDIPACSFE